MILQYLYSVLDKIDIHEDGRNYLIDVSLNEGIPVRDLWLDRFKDYQFGLKLIAQNTGQKTFIIDEKAAKDPDKRLSDWVVASYREKEAKAEKKELENKL